MTHRLTVTWLAAVATLAAACAPPAPVIEGTVVSSDMTRARVVIQDEERPSAPPLVLDVAAADMTRPPVQGDRVRVVYRVTGPTNRAVAVMHLSRGGESSDSHR